MVRRVVFSDGFGIAEDALVRQARSELVRNNRTEHRHDVGMGQVDVFGIVYVRWLE
jgi:hypothetical protein